MAKEVAMAKEGDRSPAVVAAAYDGRTFDLGRPGKRTVLWFFPPGGRFDEYWDALGLPNG